tara:strand:+ start:2504 stop:2695 length:192 start_codon:yes stop_codon:yes gene_type:complete
LRFDRTEGDSRRPKAHIKNAHLKGEHFVFGTSGRNRTGTLLKAMDFESIVSTNSTTLALRAAL